MKRKTVKKIVKNVRKFFGSLKLFGHDDFRIETSKYLSSRAEMYLWQHLIVVNPYQTKSSHEEGILHEIVESMNEKLDLKLDHMQISVISESFYSFMKDNPKFIRSIYES